jgi:hypothetical protein
VRWRCANGHEFESGEDLSTKRGHRFRCLELGDSDLRYERTVCRKPLVRVDGRPEAGRLCDGCWPDPPPPDCTHRIEPLEARQ